MLFALIAPAILLVSVDANEMEKRNSPSGGRCLTRDVLKEVILEVFVAKYGPYFEWYYKMADEAERMIDRGVESPYTGVFYTKSFDIKEQRKMEDKVRRTLEKYPLLKQLQHSPIPDDLKRSSSGLGRFSTGYLRNIIVMEYHADRHQTTEELKHVPSKHACELMFT